MNSGPLLFLGIFFTLASSFWGLLLVPQLQLGGEQPVEIAATGQLYPSVRGGLAKQGAEVYRANGCVECHSQQVRAFGADLQRPGWGNRITVARDYIGDDPVQLGNLRVGPDLANIGLRQTNIFWHLVHLYNPKLTSPGSMMSPYRYLFETHKIKPGQLPSPDALPAETVPGHEVVPTAQAEALAAYLLSLRSEAPLFEAPLPRAATNTTETATNAPSTNVSTTISTNANTNATTNPAPVTPTK